MTDPVPERGATSPLGGRRASAMTLLSGLMAVFNRLLGNVATATVGWATVLLYGRVPQASRPCSR